MELVEGRQEEEEEGDVLRCKFGSGGARNEYHWAPVSHVNKRCETGGDNTGTDCPASDGSASTKVAVLRALSLQQLIAALRLSHWDPSLVMLMRHRLMRLLSRSTAPERHALVCGLRQSLALYYHIGEREDAPFELGRLAYAAQRPGHVTALFAYGESLRLFGAHHVVFFNLALCHSENDALQRDRRRERRRQWKRVGAVEGSGGSDGAAAGVGSGSSSDTTASSEDEVSESEETQSEELGLLCPSPLCCSGNFDTCGKGGYGCSSCLALRCLFRSRFLDADYEPARAALRRIKRRRAARLDRRLRRRRLKEEESIQHKAIIESDGAGS